MIIVNEDILKIANQACLKIFVDKKSIEIRHKFRLLDKSTFGSIIFLFAGFFFMILPFIKVSNDTSKILGIVIGFLLTIFSILTLIKQIVDGVRIDDKTILISYNLKRTNFPLQKVKMKTEILKVKRVKTLESTFIIVTLFIQNQNLQIPVFKFHMDNIHASNAKKLGNELIRLLNSNDQHDFIKLTSTK